MRSGESSDEALSSPGREGRRPCVEAHGLRHVFEDGTVAIDGIDVAIDEGSFVALVGPSGCGKSTLLRLISGLENVSQGTLTVTLDAPGSVAPNGAGTSDPSSGAMDGAGHSSGAMDGAGHSSGAMDGAGTSRGIAFVFQDAHLLPWRTVIENVALPLELRGVGPRDARRRAKACIEDVELGDAENRFPDELSGGMRMRVSIARALVTDPRLLLLDEPFAALDELTRHRLDERLRALWLSRATTVLFVTHSLSEAVFLAERALVMSKRPGKIVLDHRIDLPRDRAGALRTDVAFARQTAVLYQALEAHGSPESPRA